MLPSGITTSGLPAAKATCARIGLGFDPWQTDVARCVLAKDRHGLYAADTVALSIPRQVGKTWLVGALVFADCIINPGTTTIWTAHRFKVSRETFNELRGLALTPSLLPHIDPDEIHTAAGNESITFRNGSRIVFAARERGAIRGFAKVRRLILDEAQILTEAALADLVPTMNQAENPQIILMGTSPKPNDPSEVFTRLRAEALGGESEGVLYIEFSADPDAALHDRKQWQKANPSYPKRTPARAILRMLKILSPEDFLREALGIWDDLSARSILPAWASRQSDVDLGTPNAIGLAASIDHAWGSIGASVLLDGKPVVGAVKRSRGTAWLVAEAVRIQSTYHCAVILDKGGPLHDLIDDLQAAGVDLTLMDTADVLDAVAEFVRRVEDGDIIHAGHPELDDAVRGAGWRWVGDRRAYARKTSEVSMLEAATLAAWGAISGVGYDVLDSVY